MSFEVLQFIANAVVIPMAAALWAMNARLARIEGHLAALDTLKKSAD